MTFLRNCKFDTKLLVMLILSSLFGFVLLYSADHHSIALPSKQAIKGSIAIIFFAVLSKVNDRTIRELSIPVFLISLLGLVLVLCIGYMTKGAQRWLNLGLFRFEPSEIIKITMPLALAAQIHNTGIPVKGMNLLKLIVMILVPFLLILKQPDLGTSLIILFLGSIILFLGGLDRKVILLTFFALIASGPVLWKNLHPYQQQRIMTLLSDNADVRHHGYHVHQSKIAIGSGGLSGSGLGNGRQVQLGYIPEHRTDFIFTLMSEELGFIGNMLWIILVLSIGFRCIYLGYKQSSCYNKLSCIILGCNFMMSAWINMSMVSGILPVVGIPLPLISYGGTNFAVTLIGFALVLKLGHIDPKRQHRW